MGSPPIGDVPLTIGMHAIDLAMDFTSDRHLERIQTSHPTFYHEHYHQCFFLHAVNHPRQNTNS